MKTMQSMPTSRTLVTWIKWHLRNQRDVVIELRGPKGFGKSAMMYHLVQRLRPGYNFRDSLCYSHKQYVQVVTRLRKLRKKQPRDRRSIEFVWADDGTKIFNRRNALSSKNKNVLDFARTSRNQIQAIQLIGTQDDLVERPMMESGPYLLLLFEQPYRATICWPQYDELLRVQDPVKTKWKYKCPKPEIVYPNGWASYQTTQLAMTDKLHRESLAAMSRKPQSFGGWGKIADPAEVRRLSRQGKSHSEIAQLQGITRQRVGQIMMGH